MSWTKSIATGISLIVLTIVLVIFALFVGVEVGVIDMSSDPVREGPTNTTGVPQTTTSHHSEVDGEELELAIYREVNERRDNAGVEPLVHSERVRLIARLHSEDMAERDFFNHTNPDGEGSPERHKRYDGCDNTNENIFKWEGMTTFNTSEITDEVVDWWSDSEGHYSNMMSEYPTVTGVGVHVTGDGDLYVTQDFCREHPNA